jgi:glutamate synthase (NADPH/NADH) small chain
VLLRTSSSHEEGGERLWAVLTKGFAGSRAGVEKLECLRVEFPYDSEKRCSVMKEIPGSEFQIEADLVILALGFLGPERDGLPAQLNLESDDRGNIKTGADYMTSAKGVFAAGDMRRGQSLIVWAISEGRRAARAIDEYLMGSSRLPSM